MRSTVQSTRRMRLTVKRPSTKGFPSFVVMSPDAIRLHSAQRGRIRYGAHARRAFVATRSGFQTMPRPDGEDDIEEADAPATARGGGRVSQSFGTRALAAMMTPPAPERPSTPADLRTALRPPASIGVKLFEINVLQAILAACPEVQDAGDLLILRETLLEELGPAYMWLINLSLVDWQSLSDEDTRPKPTSACECPRACVRTSSTTCWR